MPGTKIKRIREERNYSQEYMAAQLDLSQAQYSNIERNKSNVNMNTITRIAEILKVSRWELFFDDNTEAEFSRFVEKYQTRIQSGNHTSQAGILEKIAELENRIILLEKLAAGKQD